MATTLRVKPPSRIVESGQGNDEEHQVPSKNKMNFDGFKHKTGRPRPVSQAAVEAGRVLLPCLEIQICIGKNKDSKKTGKSK